MTDLERLLAEIREFRVNYAKYQTYGDSKSCKASGQGLRKIIGAAITLRRKLAKEQATLRTKTKQEVDKLLGLIE